MQKNKQKAYILIWAIFLSLIISVTFIEISTKINKNLKNNQNIVNDIGLDTKVKNVINDAQINRDFTDKILENGDKLIFDKTNELTVSVKQNNLHIIKINTPSNIQITILEGGPVSYKNNSLSGTINTSKNIIGATNGDLVINNLGGYTKVKITSSTNQNYLSQYINYYHTKKIGNKNVIKTKGKIKNF
ncbi:MAG: hypothetical protein PHS49_06785 [Candidatus Gracilibacteria bacterium]|nr:hypothetical protein [Candidatus Gracilibacteria bacterium]